MVPDRVRASTYIPGCLLLLVMVLPSAAAPKAAQGDILFERETDDASELETFPPAVFPHWIHRINYRCDACHDDLFEMKRGTTPITMEMIKKGEVCGACHNGKLAFLPSFENCNRCHVGK